MKAARELDVLIAESVFHHPTSIRMNELYEKTPTEERPLKRYSTDMSAAWEVAAKMKIALIPIEDHSWFALVGGDRAWASPAEFIQYLQREDFVDSGAAIGENPAFTICLAAVRALDHRGKRKDEEVPKVERAKKPSHLRLVR
jgi:hypothetical protein